MPARFKIRLIRYCRVDVDIGLPWLSTQRMLLWAWARTWCSPINGVFNSEIPRSPPATRVFTHSAKVIVIGSGAFSPRKHSACSSAPPPRGSIPAGAATTSQFTSSTTSAGARSDTSDPALVKMSLRAFSARITQREDWKSCQHRGNGTRAARLYRPDACPCDQQGGF